MTNFENALNALKDEITNLPEMKEYFLVKKQIETNKEVIDLDREMRAHQKVMCKSKQNDEIYFKEKALYEECLSKLERNPLYQNYIHAKEEAMLVLNEVKEQLE